MSPVAAFVTADARALLRDPLLRMVLIAPLALAGVLAVGVPLVEGWLADAFEIDLAPHRIRLVAFIVGVTMPVFLGSMAGLLILEDRDAGVLPAITVSPVGLRSFLLVRCGWAAAATVATVGGALLVHGDTPLGAGAIAAVLSGGFAVVVALLVGAVAGDRLEGIVVVKGITLPLALVLLVDLLPTPWGWLLLVLPSFGPVVALLEGDAGRTPWPVATLATLQLGAWTWLLARRIRRRAG